MADKLKMAHERRKLSLRGRLLQNRANIAKLQDDNRKIRDELKGLAPKRSSNPVGNLRSVKL